VRILKETGLRRAPVLVVLPRPRDAGECVAKIIGAGIIPPAEWR